MTNRDAAVLSRTARRLRAGPVTTEAWADGTLSGGQVAAICANVTDDTAALWADHEPDVVPALAALPVTDLATAMGAWRTRVEDTSRRCGRPTLTNGA